MNRSEFIKTSTLAGIGLIGRPFITYKPQGNFKLALIGSGWWGMNILREALKYGGANVVALCDVDANQLKKANEEVTKLCNDRPKLYADYRELLKKEKPDLVINATPDHWHALIAIAAMESGAHLFLEKPIGHTIGEGKAILASSRNTGKTCIVDFHRRYSPHNVSGIDFIKSGKVGKIGMVRAFVHYGGDAGKIIPNTPVPNGLDWDFWCGPAPLQTYNSSIHPRSWRQFLNFANGQLGDWGPHWFDQILWAMDEKGPRKVFSTGGRAIKQDNSDAPDHQSVTYEFENFTCLWEHRQFAGNEAEKTNVGVYFYGSEGTFHMGWLDGWTFYPANKNKPVVHKDANLNMPDQQNIDLVWADFMKCIKTKSLPHADILNGHRATNMALLGMLAFKHGRSIGWEPNKEEIIEDKAASELMQRKYRLPWQYPQS
jgi:predicted dehydrogenase